ncbi:MAG: zinc ABC transporter substrate-binding protein [Pseudohongiellaceae bacterium]
MNRMAASQKRNAVGRYRVASPYTLASLLLLALPIVALSAGAAEVEPTAPGENSELRLVVTIKPLQMIAAAITRGIAEPVLIMPPGQSPHFYSLTPSAAGALNTANVIVWIGEELETFLARAIEQRSSDAVIIEAMELETVQRLGYGNDEHGSVGSGFDPHVWMNTGNALAIAVRMAEVLSLRDPGRAEDYARNLEAFSEEIDELERRLREITAGLAGKPYIVYHNAFQYFERQFGFNHAFALVESEERQPGMRRISSVRRAIVESRPVCLLAEISASDSTIATMLADYRLRRAEIDLLGFHVDMSDNAYSRLMLDAGVAIAGCID